MSKLRDQFEKLLYLGFPYNIEGMIFSDEAREQLINIVLSEFDNLNQSEPINKEEWDRELKEYIDSTPYYGHCTQEYKEGIEDGAKWAFKFYSNLIAENEDLKNRLKFLAEQMSAK